MTRKSVLASSIIIIGSAVQKQSERFADAGALVSKLIGKTRVYLFNKKSPVAKPFIGLIKVYYVGLSLEDKEKIFAQRRRPRRAGKPVPFVDKSL